MTVPILSTKFFIPTPRADLVSRPRLTRKLAEGVTKPLVLISAPAGFGKTTLLAEWVCGWAGQTLPLAWLSLEPEESDPIRLIYCLAMALELHRPGLCATIEELCQTAQPLTPKEIMARLIQELASSSAPFALVLDDYHLITGRTVQEAVTFLVSHLPPAMHLILSSRTDPPLPLSRLRLRGDLAEIRSDDLRFTREETAAYLNQSMGLALAAQEIDALEMRTEGWVAGLKLAALSLLNDPRADSASFVADFAGSHRLIADYLVEEVLNGQPETVREFLLQTSMLSVLGGPLCDAVTGRRDGQAMLEQLEQENLFIVCLDDDRCWFRYHHLFAELLRHHLDQLYPGLAPQLHRRAVSWYEANEMWDCAVEEGLLAGEFELVAQILGRTYPIFLESGQTVTLARWLGALPDRVILPHRGLATLRPSLLKQPLTPRELEVMRLIGQGASNREIAQTLVVSLGTVKKHLNNIFLKLEAQSRTQAVARARELGLF